MRVSVVNMLRPHFSWLRDVYVQEFVVGEGKGVHIREVFSFP